MRWIPLVKTTLNTTGWDYVVEIKVECFKGSKMNFFWHLIDLDWSKLNLGTFMLSKNGVICFCSTKNGVLCIFCWWGPGDRNLKCGKYPSKIEYVENWRWSPGDRNLKHGIQPSKIEFGHFYAIKEWGYLFLFNKEWGSLDFVLFYREIEIWNAVNTRQKLNILKIDDVYREIEI
jgi:hypothetical protein